MLSTVAHSLRRPLLQSTRLRFPITQTRTYLTLKDYQVTATATGTGRNGQVESDGFGIDLATPKELGGTGNGKNPEQLFAMGYASCFLGATQLMARNQKKPDQAEAAKVHVSVSLGEPKDIGGFGLAVGIKVEGVDENVLQAAHEFCPYSRALKHGIDISVTRA
ncbi:OsmC-like protein [Macrolepiota fuliginosa MF-IS2]|uniref:OsmC-like protein n=1 Tax=Macrolepiota fuliginosa MF-IS2 TaxID=1400762 RepID=A0A9P5XHI9_9AGAR|nr:OsmC-like protein [Macrolepiota fuliginosa MF-IS2]